MATATCNCGKVFFTFAASRPRMALECCCCCDCSAGPKRCQGQGGPDVGWNPSPQLLNYIDNDVIAVRGVEYVRTMKLRPSGATLCIFCGECYTHLLAVHPLYFKQRVMIVTNAFVGCQGREGQEGWKYEGEPLLLQMRIQTKFWDIQNMGPLPPFEHGPSYVCDNATLPFQTGLLMKLAFPHCPTPHQGEPIQGIIKRLPPPIIGNVEETERDTSKLVLGCFR